VKELSKNIPNRIQRRVCNAPLLFHGRAFAILCSLTFFMMHIHSLPAMAHSEEESQPAPESLPPSGLPCDALIRNSVSLVNPNYPRSLPPYVNAEFLNILIARLSGKMPHLAEIPSQSLTRNILAGILLDNFPKLHREAKAAREIGHSACLELSSHLFPEFYSLIEAFFGVDATRSHAIDPLYAFEFLETVVKQVPLKTPNYDGFGIEIATRTVSHGTTAQDSSEYDLPLESLFQSWIGKIAAIQRQFQERQTITALSDRRTLMKTVIRRAFELYPQVYPVQLSILALESFGLEALYQTTLEIVAHDERSGDLGFQRFCVLFAEIVKGVEEMNAMARTTWRHAEYFEYIRRILNQENAIKEHFRGEQDAKACLERRQQERATEAAFSNFAQSRGVSGPPQNQNDLEYLRHLRREFRPPQGVCEIRLPWGFRNN
jgi:hypothetical protein